MAGVFIYDRMFQTTSIMEGISGTAIDRLLADNYDSYAGICTIQIYILLSHNASGYLCYAVYEERGKQRIDEKRMEKKIYNNLNIDGGNRICFFSRDNIT